MGNRNWQFGLSNKITGNGDNIGNNNKYGPLTRYDNRALGNPNYVPATSASPFWPFNYPTPISNSPRFNYPLSPRNSYPQIPFSTPAYNIPIPVPYPPFIPIQTSWPGPFMYDDYDDFDMGCCCSISISRCCRHSGGRRRSRPMRGFGWSPSVGFGGFDGLDYLDWLHEMGYI